MAPVPDGIAPAAEPPREKPSGWKLLGHVIL